MGHERTSWRSGKRTDSTTETRQHLESGEYFLELDSLLIDIQCVLCRWNQSHGNQMVEELPCTYFWDQASPSSDPSTDV